MVILWNSWVKKYTPVNFEDQGLFETEFIQEEEAFKLSAEEHQFTIY